VISLAENRRAGPHGGAKALPLLGGQRKERAERRPHRPCGHQDL